MTGVENMEKEKQTLLVGFSVPNQLPGDCYDGESSTEKAGTQWHSLVKIIYDIN